MLIDKVTKSKKKIKIIKLISPKDIIYYKKVDFFEKKKLSSL